MKKKRKRKRNLDYGTERSLAKWSVKHQELHYILHQNIGGYLSLEEG